MFRPSFAPARLLILAVAATLGCGDPPSADTASTDESDDDGDSSDEGEPDLPEPDLPEFDPLLYPSKVMTFNVLCSFCDDSYDPWEDRVGYIADTITRHDPDLIGLQELFSADEVAQLHELAPGYESLFYADETSDYADATIWWRTRDFELLDSGFYWLSPAPDTPFSVGFSTPQLPRLVAWAHLHQLSSGAELLFVNTHFDNNSPSQELSAPLLLERTEERAGELVTIVVGDFNSKPDSVAYGILEAGLEPGGFALTNSFDNTTWERDSNEEDPPPYDVAQRIDHIFVGPGLWTVERWIIDTWVYGPSLLHTSDHFAMIATIMGGHESADH
jgi:endonuclease/exonuclease/phosphatase family metal-dependent hydrolase